MIIYMDDYRKAEDQLQARKPHPAEERLYANGVPQLQLAPINAYRTRREPPPDLPKDFEEVDVREFIEQVSALAAQI